MSNKLKLHSNKTMGPLNPASHPSQPFGVSLVDEGGNAVHNGMLSLHPILAVCLVLRADVLRELPHLWWVSKETSVAVLPQER